MLNSLILGGTYDLHYGLNSFRIVIGDYNNGKVKIKCVANNIINPDRDFLYHIGVEYNPSYKWLIKQFLEIYEFPDPVKATDRQYNNGCSCMQCGLHNPYAEPNNNDDKYLCYNCRG